VKWLDACLARVNGGPPPLWPPTDVRVEEAWLLCNSALDADVGGGGEAYLRCRVSSNSSCWLVVNNGDRRCLLGAGGGDSSSRWLKEDDVNA